MYIQNIFVATLAATTTVSALNTNTESELDTRTLRLPIVSALTTRLRARLGNLFKQREVDMCPPVWNDISTALTAQFLADGQCTDAARAAIRAGFHDCFNGACDGSLILGGECASSENRGLERICEQLSNVATTNEVGVADLIQFAAAHAIKTCPGGPTVPVKVGRPDSDVGVAVGGLPPHNALSGNLLGAFAAKGFTPRDLVALIGSHTAARQRTTDPSRANETLDSTPGVWDNKFYQETRDGKAPFTVEADRNIFQDQNTADSFNEFANNKAAWDAAFVSAMEKMSLIGVDKQQLVDCTAALPGGSKKRDVRSANMFERLGW